MIDILHQKPLLGQQINWAHPLAKGLVACWVFNEGSGNRVYDIASHKYDLDFVNGPVWSNGKDGATILFDSGSSQYLINNNLPVADEPLTMSCWFNVPNVTTNYGLIWIGDTGSGNNDHSLIAEGARAGDPVSTYSRATATNFANTTSGYTANTWHHALGVIDTDGSNRFAFLDGGSKGTNTSDRNPTGMDSVAIGAWRDSSPGLYADGKIDIPMIWNRALSDDEVEWLYREPYAMFQQNRARWFSVTGGIAVFASISDGLGISDTIVTKTGYIRSAADSVGISDVLTRIATYIRSLASNLSTTDTINTANNLKRSIAENVVMTDVVATKKFVLIVLADNRGITDVISRIITFVRSIPDTLAISDTLTTIRTIVRSIADAVGITDVLTSEKFILVAIADNIGITDTLTTIGTFIRSVADGVGITDVISRIGTFIRSESDNVGVTDTLTPTKGVSRSIADSVGITDVLVAVVGKVVSIADSLGITDVLTFIKTTVVGGRVFIAGVAKSLRISGRNKSLTISGEDKSLKISGSGD